MRRIVYYPCRITYISVSYTHLDVYKRQAYNPTSGLGNGYNDKYIGVQWVGGRALSYQVGFPGNTSLASAENSILQEFPSDVTVLWAQQNNSDSVDVCYQMEVRSTTLADTLGGDGDVCLLYTSIN